MKLEKLIALAPISLFLVIAIALAVGLTRDPSHIPSELIDQPLPAIDLPPIEGYEKGLSSDDLVGEVVMLNVFGSWCSGCRIEHPFLMALAEGGVPLYGLNWKDKPGDGTAWLNRHGDPYRLIGNDENGRVAFDLGVTGAPETFIIDRKGAVRYKHIGPITEEVWRETLSPLIEDLKKS